jgi:hypothetical protein
VIVCVWCTGAQVLGFGETDVFGTVRSEPLLRIQSMLQKKLGFAMPLFHGQYIRRQHTSAYVSIRQHTSA